MSKRKRRSPDKHPPSSPPEKPSRFTGWKGALVPFVIVAIFFGLVEVVLALAGVKPTLYAEDPYVGFSASAPLFIDVTASDGEEYKVTAQNKLRFFNAQRFPAQKAPNTYRVFCMGGSTTFGRPYKDNTSFCGWLRVTLPKADPSHRWELINCGGISYASYRCALLMQELLNYQPDLFIIYSGQNEFLERRTYNDIIETSPAVRGIGVLLNKTRIFTVVKKLVNRAKTEEASRGNGETVLPGEVVTILDQSVGPEAYHRDDDFNEKVVEHYQFNLARMIDMARSAGAEVILVNPASNLRSASPFKSEHRQGLSEADLSQFQAKHDVAVAAADRGDWAAALDAIDGALTIDDRYAEAYYLKGRALWNLSRYDEAKRAFSRARDEDVCPLRALSGMHDVVEEVGKERNVPVVDFAALVDKLSEHGIPGEDVFLDHVHPTIEANRQLSLALLQCMADQGIVHIASSWGPAEEEAVKKKVESHIDPRAHGIALRNLAQVLMWAGKYEDSRRTAERAVKMIPDDWLCYFVMARDTEAVGDYQTAIDYYHKSLERRPGDEGIQKYLNALLKTQGLPPETESAKTVAQSAALLERANGLALESRLDEAVAVYRQVLEVEPGNVEALTRAGWILATNPDPAKRNGADALKYATLASDLTDEGDPTVLNTLAAAYAETGKLDMAVVAAKRALELATVAHNDPLARVIKSHLSRYQQEAAH